MLFIWFLMYFDPPPPPFFFQRPLLCFPRRTGSPSLWPTADGVSLLYPPAACALARVRRGLRCGSPPARPPAERAALIWLMADGWWPMAGWLMGGRRGLRRCVRWCAGCSRRPPRMRQWRRWTRFSLRRGHPSAVTPVVTLLHRHPLSRRQLRRAAGCVARRAACSEGLPRAPAPRRFRTRMCDGLAVCSVCERASPAR